MPPPAPPPDPGHALQGFLEALQRGDREQCRTLSARWPGLAQEFQAVEQAYERLGSRLGAVSRATAGSGAAGAGQGSGQSTLQPPPGNDQAPSEGTASQFLGTVPDPPSIGAGPGRGPEGLLARLDAHASSFERYAEGTEIARGGMGSIRRVWDSDLRRHLVMKVMLGGTDKHADGDRTPLEPRLLTRFLEEAQITAQLDHPGILPVHDIGVDPDGRLYFTMPLVIGQELGKAIDQMRQGQEGWTRARLLNHLRTAMEAVAFAHSRGVIHRDIKPENVMVGRFGETYVMDWGLARVLGRESQDSPTAGSTRARGVSTERFDIDGEKARASVETLDGDVVGTPGYMAPEQARGDRTQVGPRADVYSMGAVLYQVLTGYRPFGDPLSKQNPQPLFDRILAGDLVPIRDLEKRVPGELLAITEKAMAHDPDRRYASMIEMAEDLRAFLEGRVVLAYERGFAARARKWVQRNRPASITAGLALLGALLGTSAFIWQQQRNLDKLERSNTLYQQATEVAQLRSEEEARQRKIAERMSEQAVEALQLEQLQRQAADEGRRSADMQRELLRRQRIEAERAGDLARRSTYAANLIAAELAFSVDNLAEAKRLLQACPADLRGFEWLHLAQRLDQSRQSLEDHRDRVSDVSVNPGEFVASVSMDGTLRLWDGTTGESLGVRQPPRSPRRLGLKHVSVSPRNGLLAASREDGALFLGSPEDPELQPLGAPEGLPVRELSFSPDGQFLAVLRGPEGFDAGRLEVYNTTAKAWIQLPDCSKDRPSAMAWDPRGRRLALGCLDGSLLLVDVERALVSLRFNTKHRSQIQALAFDLNGAGLCAAAKGGYLGHYDLDAGGLELLALRVSESDPRALCLIGAIEPVVLSGSGDATLSLDTGPTQEILAVGGSTGLVRLYDLSDGLELNTLKGHVGAINALAWDRLAENLASASDDGTIRLWDPYRTEAVTTRRTSPPLSGSKLLYVDQDRGLLAWRGAPGGRRLDPESTSPKSNRVAPRKPLSFGPFQTPTGQRLFGISAGAPVELDLANGTELSRGPTSPRPVISAAMSAEGSLLALVLAGDAPATDGPGSTGNEVQALIFELPTAEAGWGRPRVISLGRRTPTAVVLSGQDALLVAQFDDGGLLLYDLDAELELEQSCPAELYFERGLYLASSSTLMLTCGLAHRRSIRRVRPAGAAGSLLLDSRHDRLIETFGSRAWLWKLERGADRLVRLTDPLPLDGNRGEFTGMSLSPDGQRLASASSDGTVRIWDMLMGQKLAELPASPLALAAVAFSSDGGRLASLAADGEVKQFETRPARTPARGESGAKPLANTLRTIEQVLQRDALIKQRRLVDFIGDAAGALSNPARVLLDAWNLACDPDREAAEYEQALTEAHEASARLGPIAIHERTKAALELRLGRRADCLKSLDRALAMGLEDRPEVFALRAIAAADGGQRPLALAAIERARALASEDFWSADAPAVEFLREAEQALTRAADPERSGE